MKEVTDHAASVRQRLLNLARERNEDFQVVLADYAIERLLFRLGRSEHRVRFVLKGATLFRIWGAARHRATWDLDLLAVDPLGRPDNSVEGISEFIEQLCALEFEPDGIRFDSSTLRVAPIETSEARVGIRARLIAHLAAARIPVQIDIGFSDAGIDTPPTTFPTLLELPAPEILAYRREAVVAEKFEAMVALGLRNSRMKDYFDLYVLANDHELDGEALWTATKATFERRGAAAPTHVPLALSQTFGSEPGREVHWRAFLRRARLAEAPSSLAELIPKVVELVMPVSRALAAGEAFPRTWVPGGPWR
ncbi:MAG TPA: nucleotidyl transferase AbiEii/AbiGii toxin family protein [Thermoanaerobaculia bacterium]|nr:nucleotidyl transferase AbiEii/AbiGii toxin family protein [Thermoanaerobaculia bacterium]